MKTKLLYPFIALFFLLSAVSCQQTKEDLNIKEAATGNPGDILVVTSNASWKGEVGKALQSVYHQDLYTVPQEERIFDLYQVQQNNFIDLNRRNRNVIIPQIGEGSEYGQVTMAKDVYSKPQTVLYIKAPDMPTFDETVRNNAEKLIEVFKKADRDRHLKYLIKYQIKSYGERLISDLGVSIAVPKSYTFDENRKNFAWLSYETSQSSYGLLVYRYPFEDTDSANLEYFIKNRNKVLQANVPGPRENSYMSTETEFHYPILTKRKINDQIAWEMEGLWKVEHDFMGGPFVSLSMFDERSNEFVTVEGFLYDPRGNNRDKIRKLEAVLWTMQLK